MGSTQGRVERAKVICYVITPYVFFDSGFGVGYHEIA